MLISMIWLWLVLGAPVATEPLPELERCKPWCTIPRLPE